MGTLLVIFHPVLSLDYICQLILEVYPIFPDYSVVMCGNCVNTMLTVKQTRDIRIMSSGEKEPFYLRNL